MSDPTSDDYHEDLDVALWEDSAPTNWKPHRAWASSPDGMSRWITFRGMTWTATRVLPGASHCAECGSEIPNTVAADSVVDVWTVTSPTGTGSTRRLYSVEKAMQHAEREIVGMVAEWVDFGRGLCGVSVDAKLAERGAWANRFGAPGGSVWGWEEVAKITNTAGK